MERVEQGRLAFPSRARALAGLLAAFIVAYFIVPAHFAGWMFTALNCVTAAVLLWSSTKMHQGRQMVWRLLGLGVAVLALGNITYHTAVLVLHIDNSIIEASNVFYIVGYITITVGVALGIKRRSATAFKTRLLDTAIVFTGSAVVWWMIVIDPVVRMSAASDMVRLMRVLYPLGDIFLLAATASLILMPSPRRTSNKILLGALGLLVLTDAIYYYQSLSNSYRLQALPDVGWLLASALLIFSALIATREPDVVRATATSDAMTPRRIAVYVCTSLVGPFAVGISIVAHEKINTSLVVASSLGLFLLVLVRMVGLLRDHEAKVKESNEKSELLSESDERHRSVLNSLSEVIFQLDMEVRWTFLNDAWESVSGFTKEESLGTSCLDLCHPEDKGKLIEVFTQLIESRGDARFEIRAIDKGGSVRWIEVFARMQYTPDGNPQGSTGTIIDISERKLAEKALQEAEEKYRTLVEQIPVVTYQDALGVGGENLYISSRVYELLGFTAEEWRATPNKWIDHLHPEDRDRVVLERDRCMNEGIAWSAEYRAVHRDGHTVWVSDEATPVHDGEGKALLWQGIVIDVTERKHLEQQLAHQAFHDDLTGLANRALFLDRVSHALSRRSLDPDHPIVVLFVDIDDFKTVNDSLGHAAGDEFLKAVAERLQGCLRIADTAARLGGDEFGILVEEMNFPEDAENVAQRIIASMARPFRVGDRDVLSGASIGIAISSTGLASAEELLRNSDLAMYIAKRDKVGYIKYEPNMHSAVMGRMKLKADLSHAIEREELELYYQPIVDMATQRMVGTEALLRWHHPERGMVPPLEFIPIAEESELILEIGRWVIQQACRQAVEWDDSDERSMSVNLSGRQLVDPLLIASVSDSLRESGLSAERLVLEITESALATDIVGSVETLTALKDLGVKIAIDDFGTGYSSLSYLKRFPLDILKIDRTFVEGVERGGEDAALAAAVIGLGETLGLSLIAEGVETQAQAESLMALGCVHAQGFLYSKPRPADELIVSLP